MSCFELQMKHRRAQSDQHKANEANWRDNERGMSSSSFVLSFFFTLREIFFERAKNNENSIWVAWFQKGARVFWVVAGGEFKETFFGTNWILHWE